MYLKALEQGATQQVRELQHLFSVKPENPGDKIATVKELLLETGAVAATLSEIETYTQKAFSCLEILPIDESKKEMLQQFGIALMKRDM